MSCGMDIGNNAPCHVTCIPAARGSVWDCREHPSKGRVPSPPWGRKNCKAKPRSFPQKWLNLHTLQVKQATNRHKTAKNLMKNLIQCRIKTDQDSGLKTPPNAMRRVCFVFVFVFVFTSVTGNSQRWPRGPCPPTQGFARPAVTTHVVWYREVPPSAATADSSAGGFCRPRVCVAGQEENS